MPEARDCDQIGSGEGRTIGDDSLCAASTAIILTPIATHTVKVSLSADQAFKGSRALGCRHSAQFRASRCDPQDAGCSSSEGATLKTWRVGSTRTRSQRSDQERHDLFVAAPSGLQLGCAHIGHLILILGSAL